MNCLDLTATLDAMNADFVCAGGIDWWPKLITGSVAVLVVLVAVCGLVWLVARAR